ncbi:MAG: DegT/DnrJ/EryC1/StrS family aminotransferase [Pseudomonadales bacterium]
MLRAGVQIAFYRVDSNANIDIGHLQSLCDDTVRAILITHYFGFPQAINNIVQLCRQRNIVLIEDCAHALYSYAGNQPLGSFGDWSVFSFRKSLALSDGGALVSNSGSIRAQLQAPPRITVLAKRLRLWHKAIFYNRHARGNMSNRILFFALAPAVRLLGGLPYLAAACGLPQHDPDTEDFDFDELPLHWSISDISLRAIKATNSNEITARRRANFSVLLASAQWSDLLLPLYKELPTGVCPLYFPIITADPDALIDFLEDHSLPAVFWWPTEHPAVPWGEFPDAAYLKSHLVAIPVHQELSPDDLQAYALALQQFSLQN